MKGAGSIVSIDDTASLEDLSLGLDWTQWLLRSVRQRCAGIVLIEQDSHAALRADWPQWLMTRFVPDLGPALLNCARAALAADPQSLTQAEQAWSAKLTPDEVSRSVKAGRQLLRSVRGAKHAGALHLLQEARLNNSLCGHIGLVWPVVAHVFQISPATMLAEYMRLELQCAGRRLPGLREEPFSAQMVHAVKTVLSTQQAPWQTEQEHAGASS
jgi:hypothetical protein